MSSSAFYKQGFKPRRQDGGQSAVVFCFYQVKYVIWVKRREAKPDLEVQSYKAATSCPPYSSHPLMTFTKPLFRNLIRTMANATPSTPTAHIRPVQTTDLPQLLNMNNAAVPAVNTLSLDELTKLTTDALACLVAEVGGQPAGFLLCLAEGTNYDSRNYAWLTGKLERFAYTDRICIAEGARGQRLGEALYATLFDHPNIKGRPYACEVNTRPPNPGSLRFHKRLGFSEIGEQDNGDKAVVFLKREPSKIKGTSS
ncbi:GNAT family N-acetyltransferase [Roseibium algae]|uniref:GNAT family N-acetyltransferase n=1 Tax=Roseibium algae TaxID=3123038 RepID=A0ABU8TFK2_9HYPH